VYSEQAKIFIKAIKTIAQNENNLENFESYLSQHFGAWLKKFANTPEGVAYEVKQFAEMEI
jgi:hypothetical protein